MTGHGFLARRKPITTAACAVNAVALTATAQFGSLDPVRMPTAPALLSAAAAMAAALLILTSRDGRASRRRLTAVAAAGSVMAAGSALALPHTILILIGWGAATITQGAGTFEVDPAWGVTISHLINAVATVTLLIWLVIEERRRRGLCLHCGRHSPSRQADIAISPGTRRRLRVLAAMAVLAALPYGALKTAWGLGSHVGLVGEGFSDPGLTSPGLGDTVVLTLLSIVACLVMGSGLTGSSAPSRVGRWLALSIGTLGSLMLLPVGLTAVVMLIPIALGHSTIDDPVIAPWAFGVVYLGFLAWGVCLAVLTRTYWAATRPPCAHHCTVVPPARPVAQ